jgi:hypothetical protein
MADHDVRLPESWLDPEVERLRAELATVTEELAAARLELADVQVRLGSFTGYHDRLLAPLYAELDDLAARIAELLAERSGLTEDRVDATAARERARASAGAAASATGAGDSGEPADPPPEQVRRLFRTLVKRCHPDLAADDTDRHRREEFTIRVNDAYAAGDAEWLAELDRQWRAGGCDADRLPGRVPELRAAIEAVRARVDETRAEMRRLTTTGLGWLLFDGEDPYAAVRVLAGGLRAEIRRQQEVLTGLGSWR